MGIGVYQGKFCEPYSSKGRRNLFKDAFRNYLKTEFSDKTLGQIVRELRIRYDVSEQEARAMVLYVLKKALINANGKVLGDRGRYWFENVSMLLEQYEQYLDEDFKARIDALDERIKDLERFEHRVRVLSAEACAWMMLKRRKQAKALSEMILDASNAIAFKLEEKLFSKTLFWVALNAFVFDVLDALGAGDEHIRYTYDSDEDAIKMHFPRWYAKRSYISEKEFYAWAVYDAFIEEVARDFIASSLQTVGFRYAGHGLKLLGKAVLTLTKFHPVLRVAKTVSNALDIVGTFLEGSALLQLVAQPFVEWKLEGWLGIHEWSVLKRIREQLAEIFQQEEYQEYFRKVQKLKAYRDWMKKYTEDALPEELSPIAKTKKKLRQVGFFELPPEMQALVEDYLSFAKRISASDAIDRFVSDSGLITNSDSSFYRKKTSVLTEYDFRAKEEGRIENKNFSFFKYECENWEIWVYGKGAFRKYDALYSFKLLNKDVRLRRCISARKT